MLAMGSAVSSVPFPSVVPPAPSSCRHGDAQLCGSQEKGFCYAVPLPRRPPLAHTSRTRTHGGVKWIPVLVPTRTNSCHKEH